MSLAAPLARYFAAPVRYRGTQYFEHGQVRILSREPSAVKASVHGSEVYEVVLTRHPRRILASCTCPHAQKGIFCKHLWATLLAVDRDPRIGRESESFAPLALVLRGPQDGDTEEVLPDGSDPARAPLAYEIDPVGSRKTGDLVLRILSGTSGTSATSATSGDAAPARRRPLSLRSADIPHLADPADREIVKILVEAAPFHPWHFSYLFDREMIAAPRRVEKKAARTLLPLLCATGRCRLSSDPEGEPLSWDPGEPWQLWVVVRDADPEEGGGCTLTGSWRRGTERLDFDEPDLLLPAGVLIARGKGARLDPSGVFDSTLRPGPSEAGGVERIPPAWCDDRLRRLAASPLFPRLDLPERLRIERVPVAVRLRLVPPPAGSRVWPRAGLSFLYDGVAVPFSYSDSGRGLYQPDRGRFLLRDFEAEKQAKSLLFDLDFHSTLDGRADLPLRISSGKVPETLRRALGEGWSVEVQGRLHRPVRAVELAVSSGIDWLEVRGAAVVDGREIPLPELLAAVERDGFIPLADGSLAVLPEPWRKKLAWLAALGETEDDHLRFETVQTALLDAWLDDDELDGEPLAAWDEASDRARRRLREFAGVPPADAPPGFRGELREYQRAGLGWLLYLRDFGFGGCLADDMGLGKTIQVLALLESIRGERRERGEGGPPSLVVVPRSLVFNWLAEAARFTPELRVLDYTGAGRKREGDPFAGHDVAVTTYGTLRRDLESLRQVEFDTVVLDEAQAIKNGASQTARAARRLRARHRLALTGTPVENHLGELHSLLEFLNPGLLGASPLFRSEADELRSPSPETLERLARAIRPFLLRRTKEQIAPELPLKTEQTLFCELAPPQRRLYDEIRDHYRAVLAASLGLERNKMLLLEALLRLRQAACHPGLLDPSRAGEPSAKLDVLLSRLKEIRESGHKALVFSQFTSLLALLRRRLDRDGVPYLYLDGRTRDRQARVERFQADPSVPLFLISLKAGGTGLNLTAADYVFLLDPWWNPAVEAQAIDRTHRIGQTRPVLACRIVARDTIEDKILELQEQKRGLADAILHADASPLAGLSREDLELLLS